MKNGPGTIQMKSGRWRIRTARRGYHPRWEPFGAAWVVHEILARSGGLTPTVQGLAWKVAGKVAFGQYKQAKALCQKVIDGPASVTSVDRAYLSDWAQWCAQMEMVSKIKFGGTPKPKPEPYREIPEDDDPDCDDTMCADLSDEPDDISKVKFAK